MLKRAEVVNCWKILALVSLAVLGAARGARAAQATATWIGPGGTGGIGNWNVAANWSGGVVPRNGTPAGTTYAVVIDGGKAAASVVTLDTSVAIDSLTINSGDGLTVANGQALTVVNTGAGTGTIANSGVLALNSTGSSTSLLISGDVTLNGGGTVAMSDSTGNRIASSISGANRLTNVNNTFSGAGRIGDNFMLFTNGDAGLVNANVASELTIDPTNGADGVINTGILRASSGGTLTLNSGSFNNTNGVINVLSTSSSATANVNGTVTGGAVDITGSGAGILNLNNGSITGGTLTNSAMGTIATTGGGSTIGGVVTNPAGGQINVNNSHALVLTGGAGNSYTNAGNIKLNSTGSTTSLLINADVTLSGGGTVTMSDNTGNRISALASTNRLINVDNTISGAGRIGDNFMFFTNRGTVNASATNDLTVDPSSGADGVINGGTMASSGSLVLNSGSFTNFEGGDTGLIRANGGTVQFNGAVVTGGVVDVMADGALQLNNGSITGGTVTNSAMGTIGTTGGASTLGGTVTNPAGGQINVNNSHALVLTGGAGNSYTNAGNIKLNSTGSTTSLLINADVTLSGGGTVTMSDNTGNRISALASTNRLINVDNTISGAGRIGDNFMFFTNRGTVNASATNDLTVDPSSGADGVINGGTMASSGSLVLNSGSFTNFEGGDTGLIRANGGTVQFNGAVVTGGVVDVMADGALQLNNGSITGGTVTNSAMGTIGTTGGTSTLGGAVTNPAGGRINVNNSHALVLTGGAGNSYANGGDIALNSTGSSTSLVINGDVTLTGGGTVTMSDNTGNRIASNSSGANLLTNVNNTISGAGRIGENFMRLDNQGTIRADQPTTLTVDVTTAVDFTTSGMVKVNAGSTLAMGGNDVYTQTAGSTIVNGTLTLSGPTTMALQGGTLGGGGTVTGAVANTGGTVAPGNSPGILSVTGNYAQAAGGAMSIELNGTVPGTGYDQLSVTGTASLDGALNVSAGFTPAEGAAFIILANDGGDPISGTFAGLPQGSTLVATNADLVFRISYNGGDGNDVVLTHVVPKLSISDAADINPEGDAGTTNATFTVTLSEAISQALTVKFNTADGTATAPDDYVAAAPTTLTFAPGDQMETITVAVNGDTRDEFAETFFVELKNPKFGEVLDGRGRAYIIDDDAPPTMRIADVPSVVEGSGGSTSAVFKVLLSQPSGKTVKVDFATANNTAIAPGDYTAQTGTLTINPGAPEGEIVVPVVADLIDENSESFRVLLNNPVNATITDKTGVCYILDDDAPPTITIEDANTVTEGPGVNMTFRVRLSGASAKPISVGFATEDASAVAPGDYTAKSGTLNFNPGVTLKTFTVPVVDDALDENFEAMRVRLSNPVNATIGDGVGVGHITDDEPFPTLSIANVPSVVEGNSGTVNATFRVTLSAPSGRAVQVSFRTRNGTAVAPDDYTARPLTTITFAIGETSRTINVAVKGDTLDEVNENFRVELLSPVNAKLSDSVGTCYIIDDDSTPGAPVAATAAPDSPESPSE